MKQYGVYAWATCIILMPASLIIFRNDMIDYISRSISSQMPGSRKNQVSEIISEQFDYSRNGKDYIYTFHELGAVSCSACRQMQEVMEKIRS